MKFHGLQDESWTQQLLLWLPGMALYSVDVYTRLQACKCEAAVVNMMLAGERGEKSC